MKHTEAAVVISLLCVTVVACSPTTRCPQAQQLEGVITKIDLNEGKLTLQYAEGKTREFSASKETLQSKRVGDRIQITKRMPPGC